MKNFFSARFAPVIGVIAFVAVIGFGVAACKGDDNDPAPQTVTYSGTANSSTYTLKITGDTYELTVKTGSTVKTSSGTVSKTSNTFTLTPTGATDPFTVTVSGSGITAMTGTITFTDGNQPQQAPTTVTPPPTGGDGSLGNTLTITNAQVYTTKINWTDDDEIEFTPSNDTVSGLTYAIFANLEGQGENFKSLNDIIDGEKTVTLTDGKLNVKLGTPKAAELASLDSLTTIYQGVTITPPSGVKGIMLMAFINSDNYDNATFVQQVTGNGGQIMYWYVDKDLTMSGTTTFPQYSPVTGEAVDIEYVFTINFKAGWNTMITEQTETRATMSSTPTANDKWIVRKVQ